MKTSIHTWFSTGSPEVIPDDLAQDFESLGLPIPQNNDTMHGYTGRLMFLDDYALAVRIDRGRESAFNYQPVVNHPMVLQPVHTIETKDYRIEVCPGLEILTVPQFKQEFGYDETYYFLQDLSRELKKSSINFWDQQLENIGFMSDPDTDKKIPIIIDRNAVSLLSDDMDILKTSLENQQSRFAPLKNAFSKKSKKRAFSLAREFKEKGVLQTGWHATENIACKTGLASQTAKAYAPRLQDHHKKTFGFSF